MTKGQGKPAGNVAAAAAAVAAALPGAAAATTEAARASTDKTPERRFEPVEAARLHSAEYQRNVWVVNAMQANQPPDLLKPEYWAHVSSKMRAWDRIEVRAYDGTWFAELIVLEAGRSWARVHMLGAIRLTTTDVARTMADRQGQYEISFRGPQGLWSVIRKSDKEVMHEGEATEGGALDWLNERLKAEAR
ncbi:MAG TPA: hypothetical protein VF151_10860 [Gemmatimonadales bacterium]